MRLLGFNTGQVRAQTIGGEQVQTAFIKCASPEPWMITESGADAAPPLGEPLAEMVREVEVRDHVELDDLP